MTCATQQEQPRQEKHYLHVIGYSMASIHVYIGCIACTLFWHGEGGEGGLFLGFVFGLTLSLQ